MTPRRCFCLALAAALTGPAAATDYVFGRIEPSVSPAQEPNAVSRDPALSADGLTLAFETSATNFFPPGSPGATTGAKIVAVDLRRGAFDLVSASAAGAAGNGNSFAASVSADGRYVAFETQASNLLPGQNSSGQVLRKDRATGAIVLVSASPDGTPASGSAAGQARSPAIAGDGRLVAFVSDDADLGLPGDSAGTNDVFVKHVETGAIEHVSRTVTGGFANVNAQTLTPNAMSSDGRFVVFTADSALLSSAPSGGGVRVYVRDRVAGTTRMVSVAAGGGAPANAQSDLASISPSGRYVVFRSFATDLVSPPLPGGSISRVFVRDLETGVSRAVPLPAPGLLNPPIAAAANGCREARVSNLGDVLMVCFMAAGAPNQVFVELARSLFLVSEAAAGANVFGNDASGPGLGFDASARSMAFSSRATNLIPADGNGREDVFILADVVLLDTLLADGFE